MPTRGDTHPSAPPTGTCHSRRSLGGDTHAQSCWDHRQKSPRQSLTRCHSDTHPRPPDSLACIHKPTHSDPLSHTQPSCLHSRPTQVTLTVIYFYTATRSHSPTCAATPPHASHPVPHYDATHRVPCPHPPSHAVTTGDRHTKKSLRQSLAHAPSDSRQSHAVTHSHPMDGEPQAP